MPQPAKSKFDKEEENEFSFKELLVKSANYLPLFVIFLVVSFAVALVYIHFQTPLYSTSIKLLLKDFNTKGGGQTVSDQVLPQATITNKTNLTNEIEILKSAALMSRVVEDQQLNTVYHSVGKVNTFELFSTDPATKFIRFSAIKDSSRYYTVMIQVDEDGNIYTLNGDKKTKVRNHVPIVTPSYTYVIDIADTKFYQPDNKYTATWVPTPILAAQLASTLNVYPLSKDATILIITTTSQVPVKSQVVLNSLVDEYSNFNIEQNNQFADNTIHFIDNELLLISDELNNVENNIKTFKQNNALDIQQEGTQEVGKAQELKDKLNDQELQMNVADMVGKYIDNPQRKYELVPSNLGISDVTLGGLITAYNQGVLQRQELLKTLGEQNLQVKTLESQLDDYRSKIMESINNIRALYTNLYNNADTQYKTVLSQITTIPEKQKQLIEIERQQGIKEKLYLYLLEKKEEFAISRAAATAKSNSIDQAQSWGPINLKNSNVYLMALFAGLGIPLLIVYLMDLMNDKLTTRQEILKNTDAPIIGEISHFADQERKIIAGKTRGILPEQFRIVRTNLRYFLSKDKTGNCILVTSTMPGEGKTFVSMNFAAVLAVSGKKTVLIEFDMRRPKISESLDLTKESTDLAAFLTGDFEPSKIIRQTKQAENLFVITTSYVPPNPAELLLSERIAVLFSYLKNNFDYIVIDTPPLGIVSDAKVLAEYADLSIYVIRQRFTQRRQVKTVNDIYHDKKLPNLALVVNDVKAKGIRGYYGYSYYSGGSYGYDYSFGYDYSTRKKSKWQKFRAFFK
ncbi:MAG TPA: polysaccharide biosynthesis tyrosine autokinase [Chitinophagaceae bacterium]|nr:polysaccharide biosynthesis tyrosine autokinase [Chitinophagaceae bacterium]